MAEQAPLGTEPAVSAYLNRMFNRIQTKIEDSGKLPVRKLLAPKPVVGKLYYYFGPILEEGIPTIIDKEGLWVNKSTGYEFVA